MHSLPLAKPIPGRLVWGKEICGYDSQHGEKTALSLLRTQGEGDKIVLHGFMRLHAGRVPGKTHPLLSSKFPMDGAKPHLRVHTVDRKIVLFIPGSTHLTFLPFLVCKSCSISSGADLCLADLSHLPVARLFLVIYSGALQNSQRSTELMLENIDLQGWEPIGLLPAKTSVICRQSRAGTITLGN